MRKYLAILGLMTTFCLTAQAGAEDWNDQQYCSQQRCGSGTFEVGGEWLYWKAEQGQMELAAQVNLTPGQETTVVAELLRPDFKTESGYRVYGSYECPDRRWKISATYTHLPSKATVTVNDDPLLINTDFIALLTRNFPILMALDNMQLSSFASQWDLEVNYADIDLSRSLALCECLQIRPHIGLRGFWMNQKLRMEGTRPGAFFNSRLKERFCALGLEAGLYGAWNICSGLSLVGHVGGSLLYACIRNTSAANLNSEEQGILHISYTDRVRHATPSVDSFIGIQYAPCFCGYRINVQLGWEQHILFDTNQLSLSEGNLTMQGLTFGGSFGF